MNQARCPICDRELTGNAPKESPFRPFCGKRCQTIDLARWLDQRYALPAPSAGADSDEEYDSEPHSP